MIDDKKPDTAAQDDPLSSFETVATPPPAVKRQKLSRNTRTLIAVTAIMAVLAILVAVLLPLLSPAAGNSNLSSTDSIPETVYPLYDHAKDDTDSKIVQSVAITFAGDSYTVYYDTAQGVYLLRGYEDLRLGSTVDELVGCATTLNAYDRVETVENLADFGLETPVAVATVTYHDGNTVTLQLGNTTPDDEGCYVRLADSDTVYMLDYDSASLFKQAKNALVERSILSAPTVHQDDEDGKAVLKELTITTGGNTLAMRQSEAGDGIEYSYSSLIITKPYVRMIDETVSSALESFTYIIASDAAVLHPTAKDKADYGFQKPLATVSITLAVQSTVESDDTEADPEVRYYNTSTSTLTVGSKDANGNYYVTINDHNAIYRVAAGLLSPVVERTYENTVNPLLFIKNITSLGELSVTIDGQKHILAISHDATKEERDDQLTVLYNGTKLSTPDFRTLYSQTMGLSRYGTADAAPSGQPAYRIEMKQTDGTLFLALDFYKQSASLYTVRTTEGELFTVKSSSIDNWLTQFNNYIAGKGVADI